MLAKHKAKFLSLTHFSGKSYGHINLPGSNIARCQGVEPAVRYTTVRNIQPVPW